MKKTFEKMYAVLCRFVDVCEASRYTIRYMVNGNEVNRIKVIDFDSNNRALNSIAHLGVNCGYTFVGVVSDNEPDTFRVLFND